MLRRAEARKHVKRQHKSKYSETPDLPDDITELEKAVLGDDEHIVQSLERTSPIKRRGNAVKPQPAAWEDEDDERILVKQNKRVRYMKEQTGRNKDSTEQISGEEYHTKLKNEFQKVAGNPEWAKLKWEKNVEDEENSDDEGTNIVQSTGNYLDESVSLPKSIIQLKACTDANKEDTSSAKIRAAEFHPNAQVMLTGSFDHRLALFQIDGKTNPKIQSIYLDNFPIHQAHFTLDGQEVIVSSHYKSFYYYDMIAGKVVTVPKFKGLEEKCLRNFEMSPDGQFIVFMGGNGYMHFVSAKSKELIDSIKMNGSVESIAFSPDSNKMYSHGDDGEVYIWDMARRCCTHRFRDDGCVKGTALATSQNGQYVAAGSHSGVVNIYESKSLTESSMPTPVKSIMNLTSPCTNLKFNPTTEILAMSSNYAENALKLVHLSSMTTFQNFPERTDPLRIVQSMDFSLRSGYFTIGNNKGRALLYRVSHYKDY